MGCARAGGGLRARSRALTRLCAAARSQAAEAEEEKIPLTEEERVALDIYFLRQYRCNSPPVDPYAEAEKEGDILLLHEIFEPGRWRIDSKRPRESTNHAKIMASLDADGENSPYCKCVDPVTGCNGLHAAVINGYLELTKVREASPIERGHRARVRRLLPPLRGRATGCRWGAPARACAARRSEGLGF